jgi:phosphoglycolate phosphatase-like HAD superfamily hydrolase
LRGSPEGHGDERNQVRPDAVIFDIDGTLLDSVDLHAQAWVEAFAHFGYHVEAARVRPHIGKGGDQLMPVFIPSAVLQTIEPELERYRGDLFTRTYLPRIKPFPKVRELLLKVREHGQRIALASSGKKNEVDRYKQIAQVADLIDIETSADDAERSKPAPDIFEAVRMKLSPLPPSRMLVVGDTPYDAEAARQVDLKTIGLLCGGTPLDTLRAAGCIAVFQDPADLLAHYDESPLAGARLSSAQHQ